MTGLFEAPEGFVFESTKTYTHAHGLSCSFRQWRANHSHCQYIHGYSLEVKLTFQATELDDRYWCVDFGGLKAVKKWLEDNFDHKTLVAEDDPKLVLFREMEVAGLIQLNIVPDIGCEKFAQFIFEHVNDLLIGSKRYLSDNDSRLMAVEVREHQGNSAIYRRVA